MTGKQIMHWWGIVSIAVLLCLPNLLIVAQSETIDSLLQVVEQTTTDTAKAKLFVRVAKELLYTDPSKGLNYASQARKIFVDHKVLRQLPGVWGLEANFYYILGKKGESRQALKESIASYMSIGDKKGAAVSQLNLGILYKIDGVLDSTLALIARSLTVFEELSDTVYYANAIQLRGTVYETRGYQELAMEDYLTALTLHRKIQSQRAIAEDLMTLSALYMEMENHSVARDGFEEAIELYDAMNNSVYKAQAMTYLGLAELRLGDATRAVALYREALAISRQTSNRSNEARTSYHLAQLLREQGDLAEARVLIDSAIAGFGTTNNLEFLGLAELEAYSIYSGLDLNTTASNMLNQAEEHIVEAESLSSMIDLEEIRSEYLRENKRYVVANASLVKLMSLRDSLSEINNDERIEELKIMHEIDKKEQRLKIQSQQIQILEQQARVDKTWRILMIGGLFMLFALILAVYYGLRQRLKRAHLEREKSNLELEHKKRELTSFATQLAHKNAALEKVKEDIEESQGSVNPESIRKIVHHLDRTLEGASGWTQFFNRFEDLNPSFIKQVRASYPNVTSNETRLMALIKLNMANQDIASLLNISKDGVKKARYRLRKKLDLESGQDLDAIVHEM